MDKSSPDAMVQAILEPDAATREGLSRKRAEEARGLAERRLIAMLVLVGSAAGAVFAYFSDQTRISTGVLWGGIAASFLGWAFVGWRRRRPAP